MNAKYPNGLKNVNLMVSARWAVCHRSDLFTAYFLWHQLARLTADVTTAVAWGQQACPRLIAVCPAAVTLNTHLLHLCLSSRSPQNHLAARPKISSCIHYSVFSRLALLKWQFTQIHFLSSLTFNHVIPNPYDFVFFFKNPPHILSD